MQNTFKVGEGHYLEGYWYWAAPRSKVVHPATFETITFPDLDLIKQWCTNTFGIMDESKTGRWYCYITTLYFRYEKDRDWFVLRWA